MQSFFFPFLLAGLLQAPAPTRPAPAAKPAPAAFIAWSAERRLTLADFQGRAPMGDPLAASTSSNIKADAACKDYVFSSTVTATFDPATSWLRNPKTASESLLRHEQLHFDITEVYARRLRQQLSAMHTPCNQLGSTFDRISQQAYADWQQAEDAYDRDTSHGLQHERQAQWEAQVRQQLLDLAAFAEKDA